MPLNHYIKGEKDLHEFVEAQRPNDLVFDPRKEVADFEIRRIVQDTKIYGNQHSSLSAYRENFQFINTFFPKYLPDIQPSPSMVANVERQILGNSTYGEYYKFMYDISPEWRAQHVDRYETFRKELVGKIGVGRQCISNEPGAFLCNCWTFLRLFPEQLNTLQLSRKEFDEIMLAIEKDMEESIFWIEDAARCKLLFPEMPLPMKIKARIPSVISLIRDEKEQGECHRHYIHLPLAILTSEKAVMTPKGIKIIFPKPNKEIEPLPPTRKSIHDLFS
jgi:hypothetical protein